jgi:hypothetical protein
LANLATFTQGLVNYTKGNKKTKKGLILSSTKKKEKMDFRKEKIAKLEKLEKAQERKGK